MRQIRPIDILGHGAVVRGFLQIVQQKLPRASFGVITRKPVPAQERSANGVYQVLSQFVPTDGTLFFCCSVNEEEILRKANGRGRLSAAGSAGGRLLVAQENLRLTLKLAQRGIFDHGTIFVLTNPSEIMAQVIRHVAKNGHVYALGLSADRRRYETIFRELGADGAAATRFELGGNHWDRPRPFFARGSRLPLQLKSKFGFASLADTVGEQLLLNYLHELLQEKIKDEFQGFKPPAHRGAEAVLDAVVGLRQQSSFIVSGFAPSLGTFAGGVYNPTTSSFRMAGDMNCASLQRSLRDQKAAFRSLWRRRGSV